MCYTHIYHDTSRKEGNRDNKKAERRSAGINALQKLPFPFCGKKQKFDSPDIAEPG